MQIATTNNLFLIDGRSFKVVLADLQTTNRMGEFYQQITKGLIKGVYTKQAFNVLAGRLINLADHAYQLRQIDTVGQISRLLTSLPLPRQYESISNYYRAIQIKKNGKIDEARTFLGCVADEAPLQFRARAIMSLGITFFESGDFQSALSLYSEAGRAAKYLKRLDPITIIGLQAAQSFLKSLDGNHRGALSQLESMLPFVRMISSEYPFLWYQHLNSLAIELSEVGRIEEAQNICRVVVASPYVKAYPEWHETLDDIEVRRYRASRSVLSLNHRALNLNNVLRLPERSLDAGSDKSHRSPFHQRGSVTRLQDWKLKMVKQPDDAPENNDKNNSDYTDKELVLKVMEVVASRNFSRGKMLEILDYLETTPDEPPDSESS